METMIIMTNNLEAVKEKSLELLKDFKGVIELGDFSRFLLLNFGGNAQGPPKMLAALGIGSHTSLTLSHDPLRGIYFNKILGGNQEQGQVFIYIKKSPITEKFLDKNPVKILSSNLSNNEVEAMGIGTKRKKLVHVLASDFQLLESLEQPNGKKIKLAIDLVYSNLKGFIAGYDVRSRVFLLEAEDGDLLFDINYEPLMKKEDVNLLTFDVYFDPSMEIRNHKYIMINEEGETSLVNDINMANMMNADYCLVVKVKSFNFP